MNTIIKDKCTALDIFRCSKWKRCVLRTLNQIESFRLLQIVEAARGTYAAGSSWGETHKRVRRSCFFTSDRNCSDSIFAGSVWDGMEEADVHRLHNGDNGRVTHTGIMQLTLNLQREPDWSPQQPTTHPQRRARVWKGAESTHASLMLPSQAGANPENSLMARWNTRSPLHLFIDH